MSRGLLSHSTCASKAEPGKLDIKRRESGIFYLSVYLLVLSLKNLAIMTKLSFFCVDSALLMTSFKK